MKIDPRDKEVGYWVLAGAIMLTIQVLLGGITRLSGSGLSITEWDVLTGTLPPMTDHGWMKEFSLYRQTPQYKLLNNGFTLSDFKFIFFWEWFHRLWARLVAVVFLVGFVYLVWKRKMKGFMIPPLVTLFLLGAFQGAIGWIMVASGLTGDALYVKPTKLALHFIFALVLISYTFWFSLQLLFPRPKKRRNGLVLPVTWTILAVLFFQLLYGALMAGNKAAAVAPTWPSINGDFIPASLFRDKPLLLNFIDNKMTIHFVHRALAYLLLVLVFIWTWVVRRTDGTMQRLAVIPLLLILLQVLLGITAVLVSPGIVANHWGGFDWVALCHQVTGMLFLLTMVYWLYDFQRR